MPIKPPPKPKHLLKKNKTLQKRLNQKLEELKQSPPDTVATKKFPQPKNSSVSNKETDWEKEYNNLNEKYRFLLADFANYKKQQLKQLKDRKKYEGQKVIEQLISIVLDDFERALEHVKTLSSSTEEIKGLISGFNMIYDNFKKMLNELGVKQKDDTGQIFNPTVHYALDYVEDSLNPPKHILQTVKKAYFFHDRLIRPAEVIVSKKPEPEPEPEPKPAKDNLEQ